MNFPLISAYNREKAVTHQIHPFNHLPGSYVLFNIITTLYPDESPMNRGNQIEMYKPWVIHWN
jgi:hypothetical protein